jgi:hypothetical protein
MFRVVEMGMSENGGQSGCTAVSIPKTSPIQKVDGGFDDASKCCQSLKT